MVKRFKEIKRFNIGLVDYSDANWADDVVSRRSTSGYMFKIGDTVVSLVGAVKINSLLQNHPQKRSMWLKFHCLRFYLVETINCGSWYRVEFTYYLQG